MVKKLKVFAVLFAFSLISVSGSGFAGVLKSLDEELTSLVEKTEPYLVTVKGQGSGKNLIGTGIIYSAEGHLVTSSHVCDASEFAVTFKDGTSYPAKKVGVDRQTGLAVLKIDGGDFKSPSWGKTSELKDGAWILVAGNSYGIPATANFGIFSGRNDEGFLQLGVDVSPGSSGGAVLDTDGKIVGVLIAVEADPQQQVYNSLRDSFLPALSGNSRFFGLLRKSGDKAIAVPIEMVSGIVDQIIEFGEVKRGFLGISQKNLSDDQRREYGIAGGVLVTEVVEDSPAEDAGLKEGDVILTVDQNAIDNTAELFNLIRSHKPGDKISVTYYRAGKKFETEVTLRRAEEDLLLGAWNIRSGSPNLKVDKRLNLPDRGPAREDISRLESEIENIKKEIDELRRRLEE